MIHACIYSNLSDSICVGQRDTVETDGFQADTEDDEEEDCVLVSTQPGKLLKEEENEFIFYKLHLILCFDDMENGEVELEVERQ